MVHWRAAGWGLALAIATCACGQPAATATPDLGRALVDSAIQRAGLGRLADAEVTFRFRDGRYRYARASEGAFSYRRDRTDSAGARHVDVLDNDGLTRETDGVPVRLSAKRQADFTGSVNSVIYFAFLPWALGDPAARPVYESLDTLRGRAYHRVRVGFAEEGGGTDFDDQFLYWLDAEDLSLDYLAYSYRVDGGGVRFREAFNERRVGGLTVRDYRNYAAKPEGSVRLEEMAAAFEAGELELLSAIALEDVRVIR